MFVSFFSALERYDMAGIRSFFSFEDSGGVHIYVFEDPRDRIFILLLLLHVSGFRWFGIVHGDS